MNKKAKKARKVKISKRGRINEGRPPKFDSVEDMQEGIEQYFESCKRDKHKIPSKSGLAVFFDTTTETLLQYESKKEYSSTLKRAYDRIKEAWVQRLGNAYPTGAIFYLKNAFKDEFRDRHELDAPPGTFNPVVIVYGNDDHLAEVMKKRAKK